VPRLRIVELYIHSPVHLNGPLPYIFSWHCIIIIIIMIIILPSFLPLGATAQGEFGLLNNLPPFFSIPRLTAWFLNNLVFMV
jgi:hypothetical protein